MSVEITLEQQKQAVELFAQGYSRSEVVTILIDDDETIRAQLNEMKDDPKFRQQLADRLRSCDPSSKYFAITKHKDYYEDQKRALKDALSERYQNLVVKSVEWITKSIEAIDAELIDMRHSLKSALETTPVGASEYIAVQNAVLALEKRKIELQDKLLERLERIHQQTMIT